jgi:hypothetical protein
VGYTKDTLARLEAKKLNTFQRKNIYKPTLLERKGLQQQLSSRRCKGLDEKGQKRAEGGTTKAHFIFSFSGQFIQEQNHSLNQRKHFLQSLVKIGIPCQHT